MERFQNSKEKNKDSVDQGSYNGGKEWQGSYKPEPVEQEKDTWVCPNDETINSGANCIICGMARPAENIPTEPKKPIWLLIVVPVLLICIGAGIFGYFHCWFGHVWEEADCTVAQTCTRCKKTEGSLAAHSWKAATYNTPESCTVCGKTQGDPLINWLNYTSEYVGSSDSYFWGQTKYKRSSIKKIVFTNNQSTKKNAWDLSADGGKNILAWVDAGTLYVYSPNKIVFPEDSMYLFEHFDNLTTILFSDWIDTSRVTDMHWMFWECSALTTLNLSSFNTSNVTDMRFMFDECSALTTLNLSSFNTSNVTNMSGMFRKCSSLTTLNLSSFNTSKVTDMSLMFDECSALTTLNLSSFNTSKVTDMSWMFDECSALTTLNLSSFNTSNVTNMRSMFGECSSLTTLNLSSFNTSKVTDMGWMFAWCEKLNTIKTSGFDMRRVADKNDMFLDCPASF